ncbi:MAG: 16S rRNA (uracil(1498)-N(3))-methyltransferase [Ruminococcus sp.]|nr:16S rRNA (uracil(1498)-N(3))-methyltransferase [Ruminococcus sp.]
MAWFFTDSEIDSENFIITGENAKHISKSLRMKPGEALTLVTPEKEQLDCVITTVNFESVEVEITSRKPCENEPDVEITLYQALPKGDKMEYIVQKCVELGISRIVPVISARCISRPDKKSLAKKQIRWQKIAKEAAQQSRRGIIPKVDAAVSFKEAVELCAQNEQNIVFYELGGESVKRLIGNKPESIGIFIGSEGGFEQAEVDLATQRGAKTATLGKRILRAETAPLAALSVIMYETGNFE